MTKFQVGEKANFEEMPYLRDKIGYTGAVMEMTEGGGYVCFVILPGMSAEEIDNLSSGELIFKVIENRDVNCLLTMLQIGGKDFVFEIYFNPTKYKYRGVTIGEFKRSNMISLIGWDSKDLKFKSLRYFNMPDRLFNKWIDVYDKALKTDNYSETYTEFIEYCQTKDIMKLWNMGEYYGRGGSITLKM